MSILTATKIKVNSVLIETTDNTLKEGLRNGDVTAFNALVRAHASRLRQLAFRRLQVREDAEDIVQELFTEIWTKRETLHITGEIRTYLDVALRNRIFNAFLRSKLKRQSEDYLTTRFEQLQESVFEVLAAKELAGTIASAVDRLPENMRRVFVLEQEDYSLKEVAEALGLAYQTVKSYRTEASRRIREAISMSHPEIHPLVLLAILRMITEN
ncbi:RNA polymerase sigma factor [Parapedobacter koreensis]|nr:sigma-70 family RNA polymerase sigma factor [Parapedobacter koreensis]